MAYKCKSVPELMADRGVSYSLLSDSTGIPKSNLQRYASGATQKIPTEAVEAMAEALGVHVSYIKGSPALVADLYSLGFVVEPYRGTHVRVIDIESPRVYVDFPVSEFDIYAQENNFKCVSARLENKRADLREEGQLSEIKQGMIDMVRSLSDADIRSLRVVLEQVILRRGE